MADKTYTVTVASGNLYGGGTGNVYFIDGTRSSSGPGNIIWAGGSILRFEQSESSNNNHPLIFSTTTSKDQYLTSGVAYYLDGAVNYSQYTNTTTFNAATTRYVEVDVSSPDFYYLCYVHGIGMGGLMDVATGKTWNVGTWGINQWGDQTDPTVQVTGIALTNSLGDETTAGEINAGWGRLEWGAQAWGIQGTLIPTGLPATLSLGTATTQIDVLPIPSGIPMTAVVGDVIIDIAVVAFPSGLPMTNVLGTIDVGPDAVATGLPASIGLGTVEAYSQTGWGRQFWGSNAWGVEGQYANVDVSGIAMTAAVGTPTEISGGATVIANTLNVAQLTLGVVDPAPDAMITGEFTIAALGQLGMTGDVPQDVTGIAMSVNLGSVAVDLNTPVDVTGISMNNQLASPSVVIHVDVALTGLPLTMGITSVNALIWNTVPTGSAPTDPPGWVEVAA